MMRPLGKPPPSAMSRVNAPLETCSLWDNQSGDIEEAKPGDTAAMTMRRLSARRMRGTHTFSGVALMRMRLPLPKRALTSRMTPSRALACSRQPRPES